MCQNQNKNPKSQENVVPNDFERISGMIAAMSNLGQEFFGFAAGATCADGNKIEITSRQTAAGMSDVSR